MLFLLVGLSWLSGQLFSFIIGIAVICLSVIVLGLIIIGLERLVEARNRRRSQ